MLNCKLIDSLSNKHLLFCDEVNKKRRINNMSLSCDWLSKAMSIIADLFSIAIQLLIIFIFISQIDAQLIDLFQS